MARTASAFGSPYQRPSGPWPWIDLSDKIDRQRLISESLFVAPLCDHSRCGGECWANYPESRFPSWTKCRIRRSNILSAVEDDHDRPSILNYVDIDSLGQFCNAMEMVVTKSNIDWSWGFLVADRRPSNLRGRVLFVEHLTKPVLQMLGAKFEIDPSFWSSSLNRVPSHFRYHSQPNQSDCITICLSFLRSVKDTNLPRDSDSGIQQLPDRFASRKDRTLDVLVLSLNHQFLVFDLLSVHLIRKSESSTIISYHPTLPVSVTTAQGLQQETQQLIAQDVHWRYMFEQSSDPILVMIPFLRHVLSAWQEALTDLNTHIRILEMNPSRIIEERLIPELHYIKIHQLQYHSLLTDLESTVEFIQDTPSSVSETGEKDFTERVWSAECDILLKGVRELKITLESLMIEERLTEIINGVLFSVDIDGKRMKLKNLEARTQQSAGLIYLAYLVMLILPAMFVTDVFKMNIKELVPGTQATSSQFIGAAFGVTLGTCWIMIALWSDSHPPDCTFLMRISWPVLYLLGWMSGLKSRKQSFG